MRYSVLYRSHVTRDAIGDLPSSEFIEEGDILSKNSGEIFLSKLLRDVFPGVDEPDRGNIICTEGCYAQVNEVQRQMTDFVSKRGGIWIAAKERLEA